MLSQGLPPFIPKHIPTSAFELCENGIYYSRTPNESLNYFLKSIDICPKYYKPHIYISQIYKEKGLYELEIEYLSKMLNIAQVDNECPFRMDIILYINDTIDREIEKLEEKRSKSLCKLIEKIMRK